MGVDGLRVQRAFLVAGSVFFRLRSGAAVGVVTTGLFLSEYVMLGEWAGFWAMMTPSAGRTEHRSNPASLSSEGRDWNEDDILRRWSVPKGFNAFRIWERRTDISGRRLSYSDVDKVIWTEEYVEGFKDVAARQVSFASQS
jgi:hypothetical protein